MNTMQKVWILQNMRYDPDTGVLERWVTHRGKSELKSPYWRACSGKAVCKGYAQVNVLGEKQKYHRICWLLAHGDIDDSLYIDHINGNKVDNRLCNLRLDTHRKNDQNKECHRNGNLFGASWHKGAGKWQARIQIKGKHKHLGLFSTEQEAHEAYNTACVNLLICVPSQLAREILTSVL